MDEDGKQALLAMQAEMRDGFREMHEGFRETRDGFLQTRDGFLQTRVLLEDVRRETGLVAEAVTLVDQKIDRKVEELRDEMHTAFEETQAMVKISYAQLLQRVNSLEHRVDRLEAAVLGDGKTQ